MLQAARRFSTAVGTSSNPMLLAARRFSTAVIKNLGMQERECPLDTPLDTISLDSGEEDNDDREEGRARLCSRRLTFLLTCLAPSADIINIWRYPYIAYKHGGVVLVPCIILFVLVGFPLYYLEQTIGRLHANKKGGGQCLGHLVPIFKGVGYAYSSLLALMSVYYMAILTWVLLYLFSSMQETLPWSHCGNETVVKGCPSTGEPMFHPCIPTNVTGNGSDADLVWVRAPSEVYFHEVVTKLTSEVHSLGTVSWPLLLCLLGGWIVTYLNVIRGKISFRKTAILPAIVLILFMCAIFGTITSDPGFLNGLHYFFSFEWKTLRKPDVWNDAAAQVALSLCTGTSLLQLLGRRGSKYRGLVHDAVIVVLVNIVVSFFSGVVVFSCLGFVSKAINRTCIKFLQEGFGTLFAVIPAALASLPGSVVCSILFFALLALLCLGRMEQMMLALLTCLLDKFSSAQIRKRYCLFVLGVCGVMFAAGVVFTTPAGIHILAVMDAYVFSWTALMLGFLECVVITWIYGFKQFAEDVDTILQQTLGRGWMVIWSFVTPGIILVTLVFTIFGSPDISSGLFKNSFWGPILGWTLFAIVICHIPGYVIYKTVYTGCYRDGNRWDEFKSLVKPVPLCTKVMKADKNAKAGKEAAPAPRILVIRKNEANQQGQLYIPYGFVVCPEKSPKVKGATHPNKLVFSFPDVDQSYSLTDSNVTRLMPPPRCDEIFFYTPQMSQMRKKLQLGSMEQIPQSPSSSSTHELSESSSSDQSDAPRKDESHGRRVSLVFTTGDSPDDRIVLSPSSLSKCSESPEEGEAVSENVSVGGGARARCKRRSSLGVLRTSERRDSESLKTSHV
ncbi:sodium-dependent dopamine transporter-like isoform X3 [Rhipicephalus microplus]|uniref:sodium-dependent dopamine transporter-like isoform X3 n=1 Tax=Rhipicephalus microplus TaxID=6941 RepID=UPI003F6D9C10